jgi:hypothetical protein
VGIQSLTAVRWRNTDNTADTITAKYIWALDITGRGATAGDFQAGLSLTGALDPGINTRLHSAHIAGSVSNATWNVSGLLNSLTVGHDVSGTNITATRGGAFAIGGDLTNSKIKLTQGTGLPAISALTVTGTMSGSELRAQSTVGLVRVGAAVNSLVFAGVKDTVTAKPTAAADFSDATASKLPTIGTIQFTGVANHAADPVLVNSSFAAGRILTVLFPSRNTPVVDPGSATVDFGFATRVGNVTTYTNGPASNGHYKSGNDSLISA